MIGRMPVSAEDDRKVASVECAKIGVERFDDGIAIGHREVAARKEVPLHVYHDQRIAMAKPQLPGEVGSGPAACRM